MTKVVKMFSQEQPKAEATHNHVEENPSRFLRFSRWLRSKFGALPEIPTEAPLENEKTETEGVQEKLYMYKVRINTGAGVVKMGIEATGKAEAEQRALVEYVKRLVVKAELY